MELHEARTVLGEAGDVSGAPKEVRQLYNKLLTASGVGDASEIWVEEDRGSGHWSIKYRRQASFKVDPWIKRTIKALGGSRLQVNRYALGGFTVEPRSSSWGPIGVHGGVTDDRIPAGSPHTRPEWAREGWGTFWFKPAEPRRVIVKVTLTTHQGDDHLERVLRMALQKDGAKVLQVATKG